jgi:hypothetical protein
LRAKYKNIKVIYDGKHFDSKKEARRYGELQLLEYAAEIRDLVTHPRFLLLDGFSDNFGGYHRPINCTWDFAYKRGRRSVVEDVKSPITRKEPAYVIRKKLFIHKYPDIEFREVV